MKLCAQPFPGTYLLETRPFADARGRFVKTFHEGLWRELGLPIIHVAEEFWTRSAKNVLRGMHFQVPPCDHAKVVTCITGRVLDVLLDLRKAEPTFGQTWTGELSPESARVVVIPKGVAHGFLSLDDESVMLYKVSTVHNPVFDFGIRWDSFGYDWPTRAPLLSERDQKLAGFAEFDSPF